MLIAPHAQLPVDIFSFFGLSLPDELGFQYAMAFSMIGWYGC